MESWSTSPSFSGTPTGKGAYTRSEARKLVDRMADRFSKVLRSGTSPSALPPEFWEPMKDPAVPDTGSGTSPAPVERKQVESMLQHLRSSFDAGPLAPRDKIRFLARISRDLQRQTPWTSMWGRLVFEEEKMTQRVRVRTVYSQFYRQSPLLYPDQTQGLWKDVDLQEDPDPIGMIESSIEDSGIILKKGPRASLWHAQLAGKSVVIKRYELHPRPWRRKLETCRAIKAWAAANVLQMLGISCPRPMGWFLCGEGNDQGVSYYISEDLSSSEPLRTWLRREWKSLSTEQRIDFRHALRSQLLQLYDLGLAHSDCKLSNLRIFPTPARVGNWTFSWTDLEDIQPHLLLDRVFIRNMYQINGSLPREIPVSDRKQFLKGFRNHFPYASSPSLYRYLERMTLTRHRRELRRICGA